MHAGGSVHCVSFPTYEIHAPAPGRVPVRFRYFWSCNIYYKWFRSVWYHSKHVRIHAGGSTDYVSSLTYQIHAPAPGRVPVRFRYFGSCNIYYKWFRSVWYHSKHVYIHTGGSTDCVSSPTYQIHAPAAGRVPVRFRYFWSCNIYYKWFQSVLYHL
jgi:hypothetical protein